MPIRYLVPVLQMCLDWWTFLCLLLLHAKLWIFEEESLHLSSWGRHAASSISSLSYKRTLISFLYYKNLLISYWHSKNLIFNFCTFIVLEYHGRSQHVLVPPLEHIVVQLQHWLLTINTLRHKLNSKDTCCMPYWRTHPLTRTAHVSWQLLMVSADGRPLNSTRT